MSFLIRSLVAVAIAGGLAGEGQAQIFNLVHKNSTASVDVGSSAGMFSWRVQGQQELAQQWFWFRVGNNAEAPINTISAAAAIQPTARSLSTVYTGPNYTVQIDYLLTGGNVVGAGQMAASDISETITINNTGAGLLDFHFFQYSDFDLGGPGNDNIRLGRNLSGLFNEASQTDPFAGLSETVNTPGANHGEAAFLGATLAKLNNGVADNLNDFDGGPGGLGPGDVTWALQWDLQIDPGDSVIISKDKLLNVLIVPEPSSIAVMSVGLAACAIWRRRRAV